MAGRKPLSHCAIEALEALERAAEAELKRIDSKWYEDPGGMGHYVAKTQLRTIRVALGKIEEPKEEPST